MESVSSLTSGICLELDMTSLNNSERLLFCPAACLSSGVGGSRRLTLNSHAAHSAAFRFAVHQPALPRSSSDVNPPFNETRLLMEASRATGGQTRDDNCAQTASACVGARPGAEGSKRLRGKEILKQQERWRGWKGYGRDVL